MIRRAPAKKTRATIRLLLNDGAPWSNGSGAERICGAEDDHGRQVHGGSDVHCARIITDEKMTL
jgi:hypothetical protein